MMANRKMDKKKLIYYSGLFLILFVLFNFKHLPPWGHIAVLTAMGIALLIGAAKLEKGKNFGKAALISAAVSGLSFAAFIAVQKYFTQFQSIAGTLALLVMVAFFIAMILAFIGFMRDKSGSKKR